MAENIPNLKNNPPASPKSDWHWDRQQLLGLAPDTITIKATTRLIDPARWEQLGQNDTAIWGLLSRPKLPPHQLFAKKSDLTGKCSCLAAKHPCKFFISLLVLFADQPTLFKVAPTPDWLRFDEASSTQVTQSTPPKHDHTQIKAGMSEFSRWLRDQVRHGTADFAERIPADLESMANRLIDSHMPRIASELRQLGQAVTPRKGTRPDSWPETLTKGLGRFYLLTQAWEQIDQLSPAEQNDLIAACISPVLAPQPAIAESVTDHWLVVGRKFEGTGTQWERRTWLRGAQSGRFTVVQETVSGRNIQLSHLVTGASYHGDCHFYDTTARLAGQFPAAATPDRHAPHPAIRSAEAADFSLTSVENRFIAAAASNPWLREWPTLLSGVRLHFESHENHWYLIDQQEQAVKILNGQMIGWHLLAASHGRPINLFGEWSPSGLTLLSVFHAGRWLDLTIWGSNP